MTSAPHPLITSRLYSAPSPVHVPVLDHNLYQSLPPHYHNLLPPNLSLNSRSPHSSIVLKKLRRASARARAVGEKRGAAAAATDEERTAERALEGEREKKTKRNKKKKKSKKRSRRAAVKTGSREVDARR